MTGKWLGCGRLASSEGDLQNDVPGENCLEGGQARHVQAYRRLAQKAPFPAQDDRWLTGWSSVRQPYFAGRVGLAGRSYRHVVHDPGVDEIVELGAADLVVHGKQVVAGVDLQRAIPPELSQKVLIVLVRRPDLQMLLAQSNPNLVDGRQKRLGVPQRRPCGTNQLTRESQPLAPRKTILIVIDHLHHVRSGDGARICRDPNLSLPEYVRDGDRIESDHPIDALALGLPDQVGPSLGYCGKVWRHVGDGEPRSALVPGTSPVDVPLERRG